MMSGTHIFGFSGNYRQWVCVHISQLGRSFYPLTKKLVLGLQIYKICIIDCYSASNLINMLYHPSLVILHHVCVCISYIICVMFFISSEALQLYATVKFDTKNDLCCNYLFFVSSMRL